MIKLKNCPFCGKKPKVWIRKCSDAKYAIGCTNPLCFLWIPKDVRLRELHNYATCYSEKKYLLEA